MLFERGNIIFRMLKLPVRSIFDSFVGNVLGTQLVALVFTPTEIIQAKVRDLQCVVRRARSQDVSPSRLRFKS